MMFICASYICALISSTHSKSQHGNFCSEDRSVLSYHGSNLNVWEPVRRWNIKQGCMSLDFSEDSVCCFRWMYLYIQTLINSELFFARDINFY